MLIATAATAIAALALDAPQPTPPELPPRGPVAKVESARLPAALPERATIGKPGGDAFAAQSAAPSVAPPPAAPVAAPAAAPPMPYRFVGHLTRDGAVEHFLMKDDAVLPVKEGETVDGAYRVEAVAADEITLLYVPLGIVSRLSLASALDQGSRAQPSAGAVNSATSASIPKASPALQQSTPVPAGSAPGPIAAQAPESPRTAATGTRAAHLRRERTQQLPPIIP